MRSLSGRVALVTGASSGIGRAIVKRLAEAGLKVAGCARRADRLEALRNELGSGDFLPVIADLRDEAQISSLFARVRAEWSGVDVLVNSAGLGHYAPLTSGEPEHWREMFEINVLALSICTREALSDMRKRGDNGHVVHISSMGAHRVPPEFGAYAATKAAVRSLTESLRWELRKLGSNIRVSSISPGPVRTEFGLAHRLSRFGPNRAPPPPTLVLPPEEIADAVLYVLNVAPHVEVHDILLRPRDQAI